MNKYVFMDQKEFLLKCPYFPKPSIDSMHSHQRFNGIFREIEKINLKFMEPQKIPNEQNTEDSKQTKQSWEIAKLEASLYYKIMVMKRELYWHRKDT